jgi:hypothetical protein
MTRTGPADVVVSACDPTAPGQLALARPGSREPGFGWPAHRESAFARAVFTASTTGKPAHYRLAGRSGRLRPVGQLFRPQRVRAARPPHPPHPPCPRSPALVHRLYLHLLGWHIAPLYGWSSDPGRDMLCILISPRWLQWP